MKYFHSALLLFVALIAGCATQEPVPNPPLSDDAGIKLAEAAASVSRSLAELARVQSTVSQHQGKNLVDPSAMGLHGTASIDWSGPIEPLVKRISTASHFRLRVIGRKPAIPVIITLVTKDAPIANIVRDIDFQAGSRAHIAVYARRKIIELRYAPA